MESHAQLITDDDGREYLQVHDTAEVLETVDETEEYVDYQVALATEIVQPYNIDGKRQKVYKPGDELKKATQTAYGAYITDGHPAEGVVKSPDNINGHIRGPEWSDDKDTILGKARVFKKDENQRFRDEIESGDRTDVSIGFYTRLVDESGEFNDTEYDKKQTNLVIDHLAILKPDNKGRCSPEDGCGILNNMSRQDADPDDVSEGDKVRWSSSGGTAYGVVVTKQTEGQLQSTLGSDPMEASEDNPAFEIELYDYDSEDGWSGRDTTVQHRAEALTVMDEWPESDQVIDVAFYDEEKAEDILAALVAEGFDAAVRECNCGDHGGHITVGEPSDKTDSDDSGQGSDSDDTDGSRDRYKRPDEKSSDRGSIMGDNDKQLSDYSVDELADEHSGVADLVDQKESLEDELDEMKESQRDDLRDEIKDEFDVSDERVADKGIDELEDLKETLDEVTASDGDDEDDSDGDSESDSQGSTTSTNPPNNNNDSSSSGSGLAPTSGSGQFADEYE